jgi:subtilisin family serine protease
LRKSPLAALLFALLVAPALASASPKLSFSETVRAKTRGGALLAFSERPAADGSHGIFPGRWRIPVVVELVGAPTSRDVAALRAAGASLELRRDGTPRGGRLGVAADVDPAALERIAALPAVRRITLDGQPFGSPRPLDFTASEVQATDAWLGTDAQGLPLTGHGVAVCDLDSGLDAFHPLMFRPDAGYFRWVDVDGDGKLTPGKDGVDVDGDGTPTPLGVLNVPITNFWSDTPIDGSGDPSFQPGLDFLYADDNGSGARDFGRGAGYDDATPAFGEPLFALDDVNGNGAADPEEKLVRFGSSKIRVFRIDSKRYRRGENLIDAPREQDFGHGAGATSVIAGGARGLTRFVGMAPDAEILLTRDTDGNRQFTMTDFCVDEGARVVLHEYAPWVGYHLDGSSNVEELIDDTSAEGVSHINPAGNLSGAQKLHKSTFQGAEHVIELDSTGASYHFLGATLLWRDATRDLAVTLEDPSGVTRALPLQGTPLLYEDWSPGLTVYAENDVSSRGTVNITLYVFTTDAAGPALGEGSWKLRVNEPTPSAGDVPLVAYVMDELSSWGLGIHFKDGVSEDHLVGWPGTADHGMGIAAYTGHGTLGGTPGERASYSGRGHRIDGQQILWISAPDDPTTAALWDTHVASYQTYGGTSGASPHVAGVAALLLQQDPTRTGDDVRAAIQAGAISDEFTGAVPNDDYGWGKLRAYRSLFGADPPENAAPSLNIQRAQAFPGVATTVDLGALDPDGDLAALQLEVDRDYDGTFEETLMGPALPVTYDALGTYVTKVRATDPGGKSATALAVVDVIEPPPEPPPDDTTVANDGIGPGGGGGFCALGAGRDGTTFAAAAAVLGLAAFARRRRRPQV